MGTGEIGCFVFLRRTCTNGYRALAEQDDCLPQDASAAPAVRVVAGRERREFLVDPFVLEREPFRALMATVTKERRVVDDGLGDAIFVDVDSIFFEHLLWSVYNDFSSDSYSSSPLFRLNLKEIIEFYSMDV
ncbi:hypothetical protein HPP92_010961 [Vanilla planifolia]|uniref:Uncharacterized protein n=1 Tax=Vanilla planifolia TaxID=51239 RepID=A0A835V276_VANPL|nr:hypothetical protein HPP92_011259 [Vanilla planifolia]KAG0482877.1 hypothetical protein HPP92_010961 [Vanilla planifolia]